MLKNDELWDGWWRHLNLDLGGAQSLVQSDDSIIIFDFKHSYYDQRFCIKEKLLSLILIIKYLLFYKKKKYKLFSISKRETGNGIHSMVFYGFYNLGLCEFGKSLSFRSDFESEHFKIITVNKYHRSQIKCNCWTNCHKSEKPSICQSVTFRKFRDSRIIFTEIKLFRFYWTGQIIFLKFFCKIFGKIGIFRR